MIIGRVRRSSDRRQVVNAAHGKPTTVGSRISSPRKVSGLQRIFNIGAVMGKKTPSHHPDFFIVPPAVGRDRLMKSLNGKAVYLPCCTPNLRGLILREGPQRNDFAGVPRTRRAWWGPGLKTEGRRKPMGCGLGLGRY